MRVGLFIIAIFTLTVSIGQTHRGIYKKRDCFCDNHSHTSGWNIGVAGYVGQYNFQNDYFSNTTSGYGFGLFGANKINENLAIRLGVYRGILLPIFIDEEVSRFSDYNSYVFKHWNIPLTFMYKFRSEKRLSPYVAVGGEMNILREVVASYNSQNGEWINEKIEGENGMNQFNLFIGAGTYVLFGDHIGVIIQGTIDMNPFVNNLPNYNYAFTGRFGLTYHF